MNLLLDSLFLLVLLVLSAMFSGTEIAMMSLSPGKVRELKEKKVKGFKLLERLKKDPHKLLITILIGNNLVNIGASVYATVVLTQLFGSAGVGVATGVMTFLILVFGEITPKTFAHKNRERFALFMARPLWFCQVVFAPVIFVLDKLIRLMSKGDPSETELVSEDELKAMVNLGVEEGTIEKDERKLIENVLEFSDINVETVMTPRVKIDALPEKTTLKEAVKFILKHSHTRIPVYRKKIDNIVGIISIKEIMRLTHGGEHDDLEKTLADVELKKPTNVPYSYKINRLFKQFQKKSNHMAIVRDEFGGVMGLVTMEDLLEEIVGEIVDESDTRDKWILARGKNWVRIQGGTPVEHLTMHFSVEFPECDYHDPISCAILEKLHRFPTQDEKIDFGRYQVTVVKLKESAIEEVKVELLKKKR